MQFEVSGLRPAGDMPHLDAAAATLPVSSHYASKFNLAVTTGSMTTY